MGRLTTHVLDTALGRPGAGIRVEVWQSGGDRRKLGEAVTNHDGRCEEPLLSGAEFVTGDYELVFQAGDYLSRRGDDAFLGDIVIRFRVTDADEHYHVPLLLSPYGYTTYRGS